MLISTTQNDLSVQVGDANISCSIEEMLLGITIDNRLTCDPHVKNM